MTGLDVITNALRRVRVAGVDEQGALPLVADLHHRLGGDLPVRLWDGSRLGPVDMPFTVVLSSPASVRALLPPSDLTAGEAYVDGRIDIEGDIVSALSHAAELRIPATPGDAAHVIIDLARLPAPTASDAPEQAGLDGAPHSPDRDAAAIRFHYDAGNEFFALFLDETMTYSCAYVLADDEPLEVSQRRKLQVICNKLRLDPGDRFLDIGCGWGSLVIHAARHHGVRAVGVTLSQQQAELARRRVADAGLAGKVDIRLQDYREVRGTFDAVASIGMFEHVGPGQLSSYFASLERLLSPTGRLLNHGITTGRRMTTTDFTTDRPSFVSRHVFPDGGLVPAWQAVKGVEEVGLEVRDVEQLRPAYGHTLRQWIARLESHWDEAVSIAGERVARTWRIYLAGSAAAFDRGDLGVVQVLGTRPGAYGPLGREWMIR